MHGTLLLMAFDGRSKGRGFDVCDGNGRGRFERRLGDLYHLRWEIMFDRDSIDSVRTSVEFKCFLADIKALRPSM